MNLETKSAITGVKVLDEGEGIVQAIVSVTNITDQVNDKILPGAYSETLTKRMPKGLRGHDWSRMVAKTLHAEELLPGDPRIDDISRKIAVQGGGGLLVRGQYNLNTQLGRDAYEDTKFFGDDMEWSVGYKVPKGRSAITPRTGTREIKTMDLYEWSDVAFGAAPLTAGTTSVKALDAIEVKAAFIGMVERGELSEREIKEWSDLWTEEGCEGGLGCGLSDVLPDVTATLESVLEKRYGHLEPACGGGCGCEGCVEQKLFGPFGFGAPHRIPWKEVLHPRGPGGKFSHVGGGGAADQALIGHVAGMQADLNRIHGESRSMVRTAPPGMTGMPELSGAADRIQSASGHLETGLGHLRNGNLAAFQNHVSLAHQELAKLKGGGPVGNHQGVVQRTMENLRGLDSTLGRVMKEQQPVRKPGRISLTNPANQATLAASRARTARAMATAGKDDDPETIEGVLDALELKVDKVATEKGVKKYKAPIGTPIVGGHAVPKVPGKGKKKPSLGGMFGARADSMKKRQTDSQVLLAGAKGGKVDESLQQGRILAAKQALTDAGVKANLDLNPDLPGLSKMGKPDLTTSNIEEALSALADGKNVELNQPKEVSTLLDRMLAVVNHAKDEDTAARKSWVDAGKAAEDYDAAQKAKIDPEHLKAWLDAGHDKADLEHIKTIPDYNLCHISVKGTNLFCAEHQGETRITMPQLAGKPKAGSPAAKILEQENAAALAAWTKGGKDPKTFVPEVEVNLANQFRDHLKAQGYTTEQTDEKASNLRATQKELVGANVAGMLSSMANTNPDGSAKGPGRTMPPGRIYVSGDNYVLDGHHRWAAATALDLADNHLGDVSMQVERVNLDIRNLLSLSVQWTTEMGIPPKGGGKGAGGESVAAAGAKEAAAAVKAWLELEFELETKGLDPLACIVDELGKIVDETGGNVDDSDLEWIVERVARRLESEQGDGTYDDPSGDGLATIDDSYSDDSKGIRTVRSASGARYYGDPIGTPIRPNVGIGPHAHMPGHGPGHTRRTGRRIPRRRAHTPIRIHPNYLPNQPGSSVIRTDVGPSGQLFPIHEYPDLDYDSIRSELAKRGGLRKVLAEDLNFAASLLLRHLMGHGGSLGTFQQAGLPHDDVAEKSLWTESLHPRGTGGQFAAGGSGGGQGGAPTVQEVKPKTDPAKGVQRELLKLMAGLDESHRRAAANFINEAVKATNKEGGRAQNRQWQASLISETKKKIQGWQPQAQERRVAPQLSGPARPSMKADDSDLELADYFGAMTDSDWGAVLDATHGNDLMAVKLINDLVDLELKDQPDAWLGTTRAQHMIHWFERTDDTTVADAELEEKVSSRSLPKLEQVPGKQNWVDKSGGLPDYIDRIARHLHTERGMTIGQAIATAVNRVKKWASGVGNVKPDTRAKAAAAVAEWEAKKVASRARTLAAHAASASKKDDDLSAVEEKLLGAVAIRHVRSRQGVERFHAAVGTVITRRDRLKMRKWAGRLGRKVRSVDDVHALERGTRAGLDPHALMESFVLHHHHHPNEVVDHLLRQRGAHKSLPATVTMADEIDAEIRAELGNTKGLNDMDVDLGDDLDIDAIFPGLDLKVAKHRFMGKDKTNGKCAICKMSFQDGKHIGAGDSSSEDPGAKKKADAATGDGKGDGKKPAWVPPWKKQLDALTGQDVAEMKTLLAEWEQKDGDDEDDEEDVELDELAEDEAGDDTEAGDKEGEGDDETEDDSAADETDEEVYEESDEAEGGDEGEVEDGDAEEYEDDLDAGDAEGLGDGSEEMDDLGDLGDPNGTGDGDVEALDVDVADTGFDGGTEGKSNPGGSNQYGGPYTGGGGGGGTRTAAQGTEVWDGKKVTQPAPKKKVIKKAPLRTATQGTEVIDGQVVTQPAPKKKVAKKVPVKPAAAAAHLAPGPNRATLVKGDDDIEIKAGRMLSTANANAIQSALDQLTAILTRAGLIAPDDDADDGIDDGTGSVDDPTGGYGDDADPKVTMAKADDEDLEEKAQVIELDENGEATITIGSGQSELADGMVYLPLEDLMAAADLRLTSPL